MTDEKDGKYCSVCGGIPPDEIKTQRILVEGKETGIDRLEWIIEEVIHLDLPDETIIKEELLKRVKQFNYVPTKKTEAYAGALMEEYRNRKSRKGA
ncbi:MAG: NAC family transcription factor [Methanoregulaceae archaeon]|nr:NAC family transcription factor [Methanoregulaceae archaeon]